MAENDAEHDAFASTLGSTSNSDGLAATLTAARKTGGQAASSSAHIEVGVGRYRLGDEIGHGAMGRVFGALDHQFGREVAVKTLRAARPDPG